MYSGLKILLLLALCTLVKTEQNNVLAEPESVATETETNVGDLSPKYRTITLNITICIPKHGNNDTKITNKSAQITSDTLQFTTAAVRQGPKTPCNISSCVLDKVPELAVFVFQETPEKHLICSTNLTNEELFVTINASTSKISIMPKKMSGTLGSALASVDVVARHIDTFRFSISDTMASVAVEVEQLWIPTTTANPTTKAVMTTPNKVTSKQTTKAPMSHITTNQKTTQKPVATTSKSKPIVVLPSKTPISKGSNLARGGLWVMVLLVLIQIFLN